MALVYIALGANLGSTDAALDSACLALAALPGTRLVARSSRYRSAPVDASGPDYANEVVLIDTPLAPEPLLDGLQAIEAAHGRVRSYLNAPRTLDLDILLYEAMSIRTPRLVVPHPRLQERAFVLLPLLDLLPAERCAEPPLNLADAPALAANLAKAQRIERVEPVSTQR